MDPLSDRDRVGSGRCPPRLSGPSASIGAPPFPGFTPRAMAHDYSVDPLPAAFAPPLCISIACLIIFPGRPRGGSAASGAAEAGSGGHNRPAGCMPFAHSVKMVLTRHIRPSPLELLSCARRTDFSPCNVYITHLSVRIVPRRPPRTGRRRDATARRRSPTPPPGTRQRPHRRSVVGTLPPRGGGSLRGKRSRMHAGHRKPIGLKNPIGSIAQDLRRIPNFSGINMIYFVFFLRPKKT